MFSFCANVWTEQADVLRSAGKLFPLAASEPWRASTVLLRWTKFAGISRAQMSWSCDAVQTTTQSSAKYAARKAT